MIKETTVLQWLDMSKEELIKRMLGNKIAYDREIEKLKTGSSKELVKLNGKNTIKTRNETLENLEVTK